MELIASFAPLMIPEGSCRPEIVLPSSVSDTVPSVMDVYFRVRQS